MWSSFLGKIHNVFARLRDPDVELARAGQRAVAEARRLWELDVYDPKMRDKSEHANASRAVIDEILHATGWGGYAPYTGDDDPEMPQWCGLFAERCWLAAGIDPAAVRRFWPSTYRMRQWAHYKPFDGTPNPKPTEGPYRLAVKLGPKSTPADLPFAPRAGDILVVGDGKPEDGDHIAIVDDYDEDLGIFMTYEGNGVGRGPKGNRREGIVRAERKLGEGGGYFAMWLYRPAPHDLLRKR